MIFTPALPPPGTDVWTGGSTTSSNWSDPTNWLTSTGPGVPSPGDNLLFPANAARLSSTDNLGAASFNSITFSGVGYSIAGAAGSAITLGTGGITTTDASGNNALNVNLVLGGSETFLNTYAGSTLTLGGAIDTGASPFTLTVDGTGSTNLTGTISDTGSLTKTGAGTLTVSGNNTFSGTTAVHAGILAVVTNGTAVGVAGVTVNSGADLQANNVTIAVPLTLNGGGVGSGVGNSAGALQAVGGTVNVTGGVILASAATIGVNGGATLNVNTTGVTMGGNTLTVNSAGTANFTTSIGAASDPGGLVVNSSLAGGTVSLTAANGYIGATTVNAGALTLSGPGTIASSTVTVNENATLTLNDSASATIATRTPTTALLALNGGNVSLVGSNTANTTTAETIGTLQLNSGASTVATVAGTGTGDATKLTFTNISRTAGATVNFLGGNLGSSTDQVLFTNAPTLVGNNGGIVPYAEVNSGDFASYSQAGSGNTGVAAYTGYVTSLAAANPGDIVKLSAAATTTFTANAGESIGALLIANTNASSATNSTIVVTPAAGSTLTISSGAVLTTGAAGTNTTDTIQGNGGGSTINFGSEGILFQNNAGSGNTNFIGPVAGTAGWTISGNSAVISERPPIRV